MFVSDCAGCLHKEVIDLKDTKLHKNCALCVNQMLFVDLVCPLPLSNNKNKYILLPDLLEMIETSLRHLTIFLLLVVG